MRIAIVLGAAKPAMEQRLARALEESYDKIIISGRKHSQEALDRNFVADELSCLEEKVKGIENIEYSEAFSTFGSYYCICETTTEEDELVFIGHESHTKRIEVYKRYFSGRASNNRKIENILIEDPNLRFVYKVFDCFSATMYTIGLKLFPEQIISQTRNKNSFLNRYVIPLKNMVLNRKSYKI